jgi:hypothetical protein
MFSQVLAMLLETLLMTSGTKQARSSCNPSAFLWAWHGRLDVKLDKNGAAFATANLKICISLMRSLPAHAQGRTFGQQMLVSTLTGAQQLAPASDCPAHHSAIACFQAKFTWHIGQLLLPEDRTK